MSRSLLILLSGLAVAGLGYFGVYSAGTAGHCQMEKSQAPELAWLKQEFQINDEEFARISKLHEKYLSGCADRCRRIDIKNQELSKILASTNTITPEIERLLSEAAQLRAECQKAMLQHFYEVSRTMPAEQGKRYLAWVQQQTIVPDTHSQMHH